MRVYINASDVANAIGIATFKSRSDIIKQYKNKSKYLVEQFTIQEESTEHLVSSTKDQTLSQELEKVKAISTKSLEQEIKSCQDDSKKTQLLHQIETIQQEKEKQMSEICKKSIEILAKSSVETKTTQESLDKEKNISTNIKNNQDKERVEQLIKTEINTRRGIQAEEKILDKSDVKVTRRNDCLYYFKHLYPNGHTIIIGGKIDGFDQDNEQIVEVKNRRNRFLGMPTYEKVQCEIYMKMLNVNKCHFIEQFNNDSQTHEYTHDPNLWTSILNGLEEYTEEYSSLF